MNAARNKDRQMGQDPHVAWLVEFEQAARAWNDAEDCMEGCDNHHNHASPDTRCNQAVADELHKKYLDLQTKILNTPARTIAGLAAQAKLIEQYFKFSEPDAAEHNTIKTIAKTLQGMAGGDNASQRGVS